VSKRTVGRGGNRRGLFGWCGWTAVHGERNKAKPVLDQTLFNIAQKHTWM
jgi:hypothetical protein